MKARIKSVIRQDGKIFEIGQETDKGIILDFNQFPEETRVMVEPYDEDSFDGIYFNIDEIDE